MHNKKIAVVGAHRKTKFLAPYDDPTWQIWSCSPRNESELPRHDLWFDIHLLEIIEGFSGQSYVGWLKQQPNVYMQEAYPGYPGSMAYPKDAMLARFGPHFFTSQIAWMLALAITQQPQVIGLWGVECASAEEYGDQRWGVLHFLELARAEGINVILPQGCKLAEVAPLYGYTSHRFPESFTQHQASSRFTVASL